MNRSSTKNVSLASCPKCAQKFRGRSVGYHIRVCPAGLTREDLFWLKVDKTGACWIFKAAKDIWGYGRFNVSGTLVAAHRFSYEIANGPIKNGLLVLHSCDVPACVNPAHLRLGTDKDNSADKMARSPHKGVTRAKITEDQVRYIRANYRKVSPRRGNGAALARELGVSSSVVHNIGSGRTWTHVK